MQYHTEIKVRGYHADFYGHVNNARYLEFLEEDRWACLDAIMDLQNLAAKGYVFFVVNININYRRAVSVGETVRVGTGLEKFGRKSGVLRQEVLFKATGEVAAEALVTFVVMDSSGKALAMHGEIREDLEKLATI